MSLKYEPSSEPLHMPSQVKGADFSGFNCPPGTQWLGQGGLVVATASDSGVVNRHSGAEHVPLPWREAGPPHNHDDKVDSDK